jgi:hypothetical protein
MMVALARAVTEWFPELNGRALPVSEALITKENVPTLPLAMIGLEREVGNHSANSDTIKPQELFIVQFWFQPERYKTANGGETPFWAFYDYEWIRDRFLSNLILWKSPLGEKVKYRGLDIESSALAIVITFSLSHTFSFCSLEDEELGLDTGGDGIPGRFTWEMVYPESPICDCECKDEGEPPCH